VDTGLTVNRVHEFVKTSLKGAPQQKRLKSTDVSFISRPLQKFMSDNSGVLLHKYNWSLSAVSPVVSNEYRRFLFFFTVSKIDRWIWRWYTRTYILYALKLEVWPIKKQYNFKVFFVTSLSLFSNNSSHSRYLVMMMKYVLWRFNHKNVQP